MLTLQEWQLFDDLERQFYAADPHPAVPDDAGDSTKAWVLASIHRST